MGGFYQGTKKKLIQEDTPLRKFGCSFRLCGYFSKSNEWSVSVVNGVHNHLIESKLDGPLLSDKLNEEDNVNDIRILVQQTNILITLKDKENTI